jgi:uncharacterized glyoxalase superfamily protein PhnB
VGVRVTRNRSAPPFSVTPVLSYPDVAAAVEWLCGVFGFVEHVRIGDHRAQLGFGDGAVIVADASHGRSGPTGEEPTHAVMIRVDGIDEHHERTKAAGATIISSPKTQMFGERQYSAKDLAGHLWTFTESVSDLSPEDWGGTTVTPW